MKITLRAVSITLSLLTLLASVVLAEGKEAIAPSLRLPAVARPLQYEARLSVDPNKDDFSGDLQIDVELLKNTSILWLNGTDLEIKSAEILDHNAAKKLKVLPAQNEDFVGLSFPKPLGPGKIQLRIIYAGKISSKDNDGLFRIQEANSWYAFTQFEATSARRVFPCFDEPSYKVPWRIQITVPKEVVAVSNAPSESESANGNTKIVRFALTKPLPSYLVAFAVGPFEFVDGGKIGKKGTPFRLVIPKGRSGETKWALELTPQILALLENYFGFPYPYEKLDEVAVPKIDFAMEHPGLVTYWDSALLTKPASETLAGKRSAAEVCAHELAHQWFGDFVTMEWWDDTWLNEGFASWMATKILMQWKPEWDEQMDAVDTRFYVMKNDSLLTARKIREPITSKDDIENAFDSITYSKGEAVLQMFESWIGEEKFRAGVQNFMKQFAWGNATANDFLNSLGTASNLQVANAFSTFLDQTGVPLITARLHCEDKNSPAFDFQISRYLPLGSGGSSTGLWNVPVCVKYDVENRQNGECFLVDQESKESKLKESSSCPVWFFANRDGWGYYHVKYPEDQLKRILENGGRMLSIPERMSLINDSDALMRSGQIPAEQVFKDSSLLMQDPSRYIISETTTVLQQLQRPLVGKEIEPKYAQFIRDTYGAKARELGWASRAGDDENTRLLRKELLPFLVDQGQDQELAGEARRLANDWLKDRKAVESDMLRTVLCSAATYGDQALFDRYHQEAKNTDDSLERERLLYSFSCFRDPELAASALNLVLSKEFDIRDSISILNRMTNDADKSDLVFDFVTRNYDALASRVPRSEVAYLADYSSVLCDEDHSRKADLFFRERMSKVPGGPRILDQALEKVRLCSALRKAQQPGLIEYLNSYTGK